MPTTYGDYLRDRTGWFFGLTGVQVSLLVVTGIPAWLAVNSSRWGWLALWLPLWALVAFTIFASTVLHGLTASNAVEVLDREDGEKGEIAPAGAEIARRE